MEQVSPSNTPAEAIPASPQANNSTETATTQPTATQTAPPPQPGQTPTAPQATSTNTINSTQAPSPTPAAAPIAHEAPANPETTAATTTAPTSTTTDLNLTPAQENKDAGEEPQNPLTRKFTDAEWKALKEFRAQLPEILADGYPDDPQAKEKAITLWGVPIDPKGSKDARTSVVLMKFLRARNLSVADAREMLVSTLRWRVSINLEELMKKEFPQDVFGNVGHIYGRDKGGRPVVYNIYGGNTTEVFRDTERFIQWRVAFHEKSIALLDFTEVDQTVQIHDYLGVSMTSRDPKSKAAASEASNIFNSHYPELLYRKFFVNVPFYLNWIFWLFKPLLPAATLAKMSVVGTGHSDLKKALSSVVDPSELPKSYGGVADGW